VLGTRAGVAEYDVIVVVGIQAFADHADALLQVFVGEKRLELGSFSHG